MGNKDINFCKNIRILKEALSAQNLLIAILFEYEAKLYTPDITIQILSSPRQDH